MNLTLHLCAFATIVPSVLGAQVHPGIGVRVTAPNFVPGRFDGTFLGRSGDTLIFGSENHASVRVPASAITRLEVSPGKSRAWGFVRGALWGAVSGVVAGAPFVGFLPSRSHPGDDFPTKSAFVAIMIVGGAEAGGITGLFLPKRMFVDATPQLLLNAASAPPILTSAHGAQLYPGGGVRVRATAVVLGRFEGKYLGRSGDTLTFGSESSGPLRVPESAITRLEVRRGTSRVRGLARGALWGAAIGGLFGGIAVASRRPDVAKNGSRQKWVVETIGDGAELGGIVGLFLPTRMWADADPRLLLNSASARRPMSIGLSLAF